MTETRKLAAILVSDVVGYSRLTGVDEEDVLARLRALRRELIDPKIALHKGRIVKSTGDGVIVEFRSAVDAVRLKNIPEPIRTCSLEVGAPATPKPATPAAKPAVHEKPSIAALPFQTMSGDLEQEYFVDRQVGDVITGLSRIKSLTVIARNSSFVYTGKAATSGKSGAPSASGLCSKAAFAGMETGCPSPRS